MTRCEPALRAPRAKHGQVSSPRRAPFQKLLACRLRNSQVGGGQVSSLRDTEPSTALASSALAVLGMERSELLPPPLCRAGKETVPVCD